MTRKHLGLLSLAVLLAACAQVRDPQGGPKDETPPRLIGSEPANGSVHFEGRRIVLHFDERIKTQRVSEHLIVSPPLPHPPSVSVSGGNDVVIDLQEGLLPNTTYTFNIGDAVQNLSEALPASGLTYVVSTGDHLDSARVTGQVVDAFTGKPAEGMEVLLMEWRDSTAHRVGPPDYFTRSNKDGAFLLDHVRPGPYKLCALRDMNADHRYDLPNEVVAFVQGPINATDTVHFLLRAFLESPDSQRVVSSRVLADRAWQLVLAKPFMQGSLQEVDRTGAALTWHFEPSVNGDTVLCWPSDTAVMNGFRWAYREGGRTIDTLTYRVSQKMPYDLGLRAQLLGDTAVRITSTRPIRRIREDRFRSTTDSSPVEVQRIALDSSTLRTLNVYMKGPVVKGGLEVRPGAVEDLYGGPNDTLRITFGEGDRMPTGDLVVKLRGGAKEGPWILQLLDPKDVVLRSAVFEALPGEVRWPATPAGKYALKLIADTDRNGRWTSGSLRGNRLPEQVWRDPEEVQVRADWDVELIWELP